MKECPICTTSSPDHAENCRLHNGNLSAMDDLQPGFLFENTYRIVHKLGEGTLGPVYLADHVFLDQPRALRLFAPVRDEALVARLGRALNTLRALRSKYVVASSGLQFAGDDSLYMDMEYVDGPDLRTLLEIAPGPFDVDLTLGIARCLMEGLAAAHAAGLVHRDIQPKNILMARDGSSLVPKIAGFAVVALREHNANPRPTGEVVLTPAYAAPEQWYGTDPADLDGRTDLYALGGVLYRMLTGHTPFHADDYEGWAMQHIQTEPLPPSALRPELAARTGLDQLILSLLAKQSEARPRNAGDLLPLLDEVQFGIVASRPSPARIVAEAAAEAPVPEAALPQAPEERPSPFAASPEVDFQAETAAYTEEDLTASAAWGSIFAGAEPAPVAAEDIQFVTVSPSIAAPAASNASEELSAVAAPPSVAEQEVIPEAVVAQPPIPTQTAASTDMPAVSASAAPAAATAEIAEEGENFREWLRNYERSDAGQSANSHARKTATSSAAHEELSDEQRELLELQRMFRNANSAVRPEKKPTRAERMDRSNVAAELKKETEAAALKPAAQAPAPAAAQTVKKIVAEWGPVPAVVGLAPAAPIPAAPTAAQAVPQPAPPEAAVAAEETVKERFGRPLWKIAAALILLAVLGFAGWRLSYTDPKLPPAKLAQGCTAGDARSCTALAAWYEQTNVVKDGDARAVTFYGKACDASFPLACRKLAFKYLFGKGIPQDKPRAVPYFAKACNHGDYESCDTLADMYHNGTAVDQDDAQATQFYTKACTAGDDFGCEWATRLQAAHTTATAIHRPRPVATPESAE